MIVNWSGNGLKIVPIMTSKTGKERDELFKLASGKASFVLLPGTNEVPNGDFEIAKEHIEGDIKSGKIKILADQKKEKVKVGDEEKMINVTRAKPLKKFSPQEAMDIVNECNSLETLSAWKKEETRDSVLKTIQNRVEEVEAYIKNPIAKGR